MTITAFDTTSIITKTMLGGAIVGEVVKIQDENSARRAGEVLTGLYDDEIAAFGFFHHFKDYVKGPEDLKRDEPQVFIGLVKSRVRSALQHIMEIHQEHLKRNKEQELEALKVKLKQTNKPDPMGTVAELAAKYGKSKSEIRRLKAEGRLSELEEDAQ